ncbi:MAG: hypothetical protein KDK36_20240 [Leptospiraceae bacterium]|nr:hypothetical protein [Leptospiraceae bacterium]
MRSLILTLILFFFNLPLLSEENKIFFSSSLNGNLLSCTCTKVPIAGLSRRVSFGNKIKWDKEKDILIEVGDFFSLSDSPIKKKAILEAYSLMGYTALIPGKNELTYHNSKTWSQWKKFPIISTNLYSKSFFGKNTITDPLKIIKKNGKKIGILSFTGKSIFDLIPKSISETYEIENDSDLIEKIILNYSVDFWIVGLYGNSNDLITYTKVFPNNTIFLGGGEVCKNQKNGISTTSKGQKIYCTSGKNGDEIGEILLNSQTGKVKSFKLHTIDIDAMTDSPEILQIADKYQIKP